MAGTIESVRDLSTITSADFLSGFGASFAMILATEIGDRTFFIAAIMAMRHPRVVVWSGAISALAFMTVISAVFGLAAVAFLPPWLVNWIVVCLMFYFGFGMLREGMKKEGPDFEEMEEVKEEMGEGDDDSQMMSLDEFEKRQRRKSNRKVFFEACTLTFLAEWGDRSQMATIALAAVYNAYGVILGAVIGHALCTGFAVIGGRLIADYVSEKFVHISGGVLFICFAFVGAVMELLNEFYF
jgi:Ca2+/H+ antiporter, TMEM165/GDT1 family